MGLIRFILALSVIVSHCGSVFGLNLVGGNTAVQAFYVISGFYMSLILNEKYVHQKHAFRLFITNRFLRLFPIYWVVLLLTALFSLFLFHHPDAGRPQYSIWQVYAEYSGRMNPGSLLFLTFTNLFLFFQDTVMFMGLNPDTGRLFFTSNYLNTRPELFNFLFIPQAWTIGVELLFYLVAPVIVRRNLKVVGGIMLGSMVLRAILYKNGLHHNPWTYRFFPTELVWFLAGNLSYAIYKQARSWQVKTAYLNTLWLAVVGCSIFYSCVNFPFQKNVYFLFFSLALPFVFLRTKNSRLDAFVGDLSYPLYLSHFLVQSVIRWFYSTPAEWNGAVVALFTIIFSIALNGLIANRIEAFRQKRVQSQKQLPQCALSGA